MTNFVRPEDEVTVPVGPVLPPARHVRAAHLWVGVAAVVAIVLVASSSGLIGFGPGGPGTSPTGSNVAVTSPSATVRPTATKPPPSPTVPPLPVLTPDLDATFADLAERGPEVTLLVAGDTLVIGGNTWTDPPSGYFAYNPATRVRQPLPAIGKGTFYPQFSAGLVVVGALTRWSASDPMGVTAAVIENLGSGRTMTLWPRPGYDMLAVDGLADGYAFGQMVKLSPPQGDGAFFLESRAIVIDLATGELVDLTPSDTPSATLAQVRGVADGRALVAVLPGAEPGQRRISPLSVVDLATRTRTTLGILVERLGGGEVFDPVQLRLDGDLIVGQEFDSPTDAGRAFVYDIATGTYDLVPTDASAVGSGCPFRLDATRLVCYATLQARGLATEEAQVFLYDTESRTTTIVPTPSPARPMWRPVAVAAGRIVITDARGDRWAPLVHVVSSGVTYQLGMIKGYPDPPLQVAIVGHLLVGNTWGTFDARVWRLP